MSFVIAIPAVLAAVLAWMATAKAYMVVSRHMRVESVLRRKIKTREDVERAILAVMFRQFSDARYAGVVVSKEKILFILVSKSACKDSLAGKTLTRGIRDAAVQAVGKRKLYGLTGAHGMTEFSAMIYDNPPFDRESLLWDHTSFMHWTEL